jgi:uncharacterized protein (UPF0303 family)
MTEPAVYSVEQLVAQDRAIDFDHFDHADAWEVGLRIVAFAAEQSLAISAAVWLGDQRVFHVGMPGTTADHEYWMARKVALVRRFDASSWLTTQRLRGYGIREASERICLDPQTYILCGGAFPIRVRGTLVGVAVASGTSDQAEHDVVFNALRARARTA